VNARILTTLTVLAVTAASAQQPPAEPEKPAPAAAEQPSTADEREPSRAPGAGPIDPAPPAATETPKPPPARTVNGTVTSVEQSPLRVAIEADDGPVTVAIDRNTAIYTQKGGGTVRDVRAGEPVRVSISGPENRALWLELLKRGAASEQEGGAVTPPTVPPGEVATPGGTGPPGTTPPPPGPATPASPATPGR
jgi:hypothetical protein